MKLPIDQEGIGASHTLANELGQPAGSHVSAEGVLCLWVWALVEVDSRCTSQNTEPGGVWGYQRLIAAPVRWSVGWLSRGAGVNVLL